MSPPTFSTSINRLLASLSDSLSLCQQIRLSQKFSTTPTKLNRLEASITTTLSTLPPFYTTSRTSSADPVAFDNGDYLSRNDIAGYLEDFQIGVVEKLRPIAEGEGGDRKKPGFGRMGEEWERINDGVKATIANLMQRLQIASLQRQQQQQYQQQSPIDIDSNISISGSDLYRTQEEPENLGVGGVWLSHTEIEELQTWKSRCWTEEIDAEGRSVWVNCADLRRRTWVRPSEGFVRSSTMQGGSRRRSARG